MRIYSLFILLLSFFYCDNRCFGQIITTIAGGSTGHGGYWGNGGPATSAEIPGVGTGSFDATGNYYFGLVLGSVEKITPTGIIFNVAGNHTFGFSGDGGPATLAQMKNSLCKVDSAGNIYIADYNNNRVRKVDAATGIIHTIAGNGAATHLGDGGPATAASLTPSDLGVDKHGNIYVLDSAKIRKIDASGYISTIAGNGIGGFSGDGGPAISAAIIGSVGICFDSLGNVFFGANGGVRIRKVDISTGIISTIAGTGIYLYNGDSILATTAQFKCYGLAFDKIGNLFIADYGNQRIRKIDTFGIIHTVAGNGTAGFSGDGGLATNAQIYQPEGIAIDACGNLYIADKANNRIRKVTYDTSCHLPGESLGVQVSPLLATIAVYPNPANNEVYISGLPCAATYRLLNMVGSAVWHGELPIGSGTVPLYGLPPGMYVLELVTERGEWVVRRVAKE